MTGTADPVTDTLPAETRLLVEMPGQSVAAATAAATQALGPGWEAEPLLPDDPDVFLIRGPADAPPGTAAHAAAAHDAVHDLQDTDLFTRVEADLPSSAYPPPPAARAPGRFGIGGGGADGPPPPRDWSRQAIRSPQALTLLDPDAAGGKEIRIAHPDTGYSDHPATFPALDRGTDRDILDDDSDARDDMVDRRRVDRFTSPGHGTSTSSVIIGRGADTDPDRIAGVAPGAVLVPIRTMRSVIQIFDSDVAKAVDHARRSRCHVISMSLGGRGFFGLERAIQRAVDENMIVMAAAGNSVRVVVAPASYDDCLAVAGTTPADEPWSGSSRGKAVDVAAPGDRVWVANFDRDPDPWARTIDTSSGTSYAVAHLAGVAALWLAHHGRDDLIRRYQASGMRLQDVFRAIIRNTARRPAGWDSDFGAGIVDAEAVLRAPLPRPPRFTAAGPAVRRSQTGVERIAALLGEADTAAVAAGLAGVLDVAVQDVPAALPRFEGEIAWLVLHDADFAERIRRGSPPRGLGLAAAPPPPPAASGELKARLG